MTTSPQMPGQHPPSAAPCVYTHPPFHHSPPSPQGSHLPHHPAARTLLATRTRLTAPHRTSITMAMAMQVPASGAHGRLDLFRLHFVRVLVFRELDRCYVLRLLALSLHLSLCVSCLSLQVVEQVVRAARSPGLRRAGSRPARKLAASIGKRAQRRACDRQMIAVGATPGHDAATST